MFKVIEKTRRMKPRKGDAYIREKVIKTYTVFSLPFFKRTEINSKINPLAVGSN